MNDCLKTLREQLIFEASKNDWNLTQLSVQCDTPYRTMFDILSGKKADIRLYTIIRISENLGIPVTHLIGKNEKIMDENKVFLTKMYDNMRIHMQKCSQSA